MYRTVDEMHTDLDFLIDKVRTPRFEDSQRDRVLNFAMDRTIQDRYDNIKKAERYSFQAFQRIRDELYTLIPEPAMGALTDNVDNTGRFSFPSDYRHGLLVQVGTTPAATDTVSRPITYDSLGIAKKDPFEEPTDTFPRHIEDGQGIVIYHGGGIYFYKFYYLRSPKAISKSLSQDCELPGVLHDEVLQIAASIVNGTIEDFNKYKMFEQETQQS